MPNAQMRNLVVSEFLTLDGVMEDPGGAEKSKYGGWSFQFFNNEYAKFKKDELFASDAMLLGRVTYQGFAAAWPSMTDNDGFADKMNSMPKFVVSNTLDKLEWQNSKLVNGDIIEQVRRLKQLPGQEILVAGSGKLARTLMQHDLIDEYRLMVHPIVVGGGKRLFENVADKQTLQLIEAKTFQTGVVVLIYRPDERKSR